MALRKDIIQEDGVTTSYHRILFLMTTTNRQNSIAVVSYVNAASRDGEKTGSMPQPYMRSISYELAYDETMTIGAAYEYLKSLPKFEDAEDV